MTEVVGFRSKPGTYVRLRHAFLRSPAWQSLSANARAIYVDIAARYNGRNNGQIPYSAATGHNHCESPRIRRIALYNH
jgi:hypothetical protein